MTRVGQYAAMGQEEVAAVRENLRSSLDEVLREGPRRVPFWSSSAQARARVGQ